MVVGASSGIGQATSRYLAGHGYFVFGCCRTRLPDSSSFTWIEMDVTDDVSVRRATNQVLSHCETLYGIVYCAGIGGFGSVEEVSLEAAQRQFHVNYFGAVRVMTAVLPAIRKSGKGQIILVGSLAGRIPVPFQAHYSATKSALESMSFALRNEITPFGMSVSLIEPGDIRTSFNEHFDWALTESENYGSAASAAANVIQKGVDNAPGPHRVAKVIARALAARRPRALYGWPIFSGSPAGATSTS